MKSTSNCNLTFQKIIPPQKNYCMQQRDFRKGNAKKKKRENNTSKGLKYVMWGEFYRHCLYKDAQLIVARSGSEGLVLTTLKVLKDPC